MAITDIKITIPEGCRDHRAEASCRYYALTINHIEIIHGGDHYVHIHLPHRCAPGERWKEEFPPILEPSPRLVAEIKTAVLHAYRAEIARKKAA